MVMSSRERAPQLHHNAARALKFGIQHNLPWMHRRQQTLGTWSHLDPLDQVVGIEKVVPQADEDSARFGPEYEIGH